MSPDRAVIEHDHDQICAERRSVYAEWWPEALVFKWLESERVGFDLGDEALREWVRQHWRPFVRARFIEHLEGKRFWSEFSACDFGLLRRAFQDDQGLADRIIDRLRCGDENLHIICWAEDFQIDVERVHHILFTLNINDRRLSHHLDPETC